MEDDDAPDAPPEAQDEGPRDFEPGLYDDIPEDIYHASYGVSVSRLKLFKEAPAKVRVPRPDRPALRFGRLGHVANLQPHLLDRLYQPVDLPRFDPRSKEYKAALAAAGGRELVKRADYQAALALAEQVRAHPEAGWLLDPEAGTAECSFYWIDPVTGLKCRGRADRLRPDPLDSGAWFGVDLKCVEDASPEGFARTAANYGYHMQDAHYRNGLLQCGVRLTRFIFVAIEKEPPNLIGLYEMDQRARELGRLEVMAALEGWARCEATGVWPGYSETVEPLDLPGWAYANSGV